MIEMHVKLCKKSKENRVHPSYRETCVCILFLTNIMRPLFAKLRNNKEFNRSLQALYHAVIPAYFIITSPPLMLRVVMQPRKWQHLYFFFPAAVVSCTLSHYAYGN